MAEGVLISMAGKVVDLLFGVAKKEIGYMWNCRENVTKLTNEAGKLNVMRGKVQQQIDIARRKGDDLLSGVQEWLDKANVEISKVDEFLEQEANAKKTCFKIGLCGNWSSNYHYSKKGTKMASSVLQHQEDGMNYESCVSVDTPAPGRLDVYQNKNLDDIWTRNLALGNIITALEDKNIQIIGIYGLGGVGKTTLAMEVVARVKNIFVNVAFTTVSQTLNVDKIQKDIGEATKRIMKGEKVLIILDDVWEKLNLEELCIPFGSEHMNCKILMTSRSEDVCNKMNAQTKICVDPLPLKETWILLKQVVGERIDTDVTLKLVAMKVAKECGGLPLLVQAIGNALKDKSIDAWEMAVAQLKKPTRSDIDPDLKKAFNHLKLSYDYLHSEEARSCFLLCSVFPEDCNIGLEDLVNYGVGLAKFNNLESMNDARCRVRNAVNTLTSCGLLLNVDNKLLTKMHDVVRDVAFLIASEGNNKFLVDTGKGSSEWLPRKGSLESYTGISLMSNNICKLPDYELHLPHLNTFIINNNRLSTISNEFIGSMKEARVLDMSCNWISSLPQSLMLLTNVRMLDLRRNPTLDEISILGELKDLEILILSGTAIKEIPKEIGQLVNLRRFDISDCEYLSHIYPGVISHLHWLEELCIGFFKRMQEKDIYDRLGEVMKLSKLTYLDLLVPCLDVIPKDFIWGKSNSFRIKIGGYVYDNFDLASERRLVVSYDPDNSNILLESMENMNNILSDLNHKGFNKLESIWLINCPNVRYFVDFDEFVSSKEHQLGDETEEMFFMNLKHLGLFSIDSLEVVWIEVVRNCSYEYISRHFGNLVTLNIDFCDKLLILFSVGAAQGLVSMQELSVRYCNSLLQLIWGGDDEEIEMAENIIVFPSLVKISLYSLCNLTSFCSGNYTLKYPSLVQVNILFCSKMKKWSNIIQETPNLKFLNEVLLDDGPNAINEAVEKQYEKLSEI